MAFRTNKTPVLQEKSASGAVATFNTALAMPLKSCVVDFEDETGIDSVVISHSRYTTVIETLVGEYVDANGMVSQSLSQYPYRCVIARVKQGETYIYSINGTSSFIPVMAFFEHYPVLGSQSYDSLRLIDQSSTFIAPINGYIFIRGGGDFNEVNQMVATGTNTEYETGNSYTISFGQTINKGEYNAITGVLTVTSPTSQTIQLPPCLIDTLRGENNIWADTGDVDLTYKDLDIAKRGNFREVFKLPS